MGWVPRFSKPWRTLALGVKVTGSPGLQKQVVLAGLGKGRRWFQDRILVPILWFSLKIQGVCWGQGRSGFLICGSMVRYERKLAVLGVQLRNITESILGVDLGGFGSFTVRI